MSESLLVFPLIFYDGNCTDSSRPSAEPAAEPAAGSGTEPVVTAEAVAAYDIQPGSTITVVDPAATRTAPPNAVSGTGNESPRNAAAAGANAPAPSAERLFVRDDPSGWGNLVGAPRI